MRKGQDDRKIIGAAGENAAEQYLSELGYRIVARNWRCRTGEIDIIAEVEGTLVFVEVRARKRAGSYGLAKESIDFRKQQQVRETAQFYLHRYQQYDQRIRFDVIAVQFKEDGEAPLLEHFQGAF
jgi:putative endonuclease